MKGDFSRDTFNDKKNYSRVLMQQGRVQLDADWNEQAAIVLHYLRTLAADLIGPFAGPAGEHQGFGIEIETNNTDFKIGRGRYYVDGILCENHTAGGVPYLSQPDFPNPGTSLDPNKHQYLVYLDVWERHITALEDDSIREKALGGPDTASRTKVVWQVKLDNGGRVVDADALDPDNLNANDKEKFRDNWQKWINHWQPPYLGCLQAQVKKPESSNDPCLTAPDAKYRGSENQLYRIEIHTGGTQGNATFKWSRDNGAVVTTCRLEGTELIVQNPRGFAANQWVEVTNEGQELRGEPGELVKIMKVEGEKLILVAAPTKTLLPKDGPTKVRRWDQSEKGGVALKNDRAMGVTEVPGDNLGWIDLENGIQIKFQSHSNSNSNQYRTGDYWLIPARVATGDIEWPLEVKDGAWRPTPQPPHGIRHHYAPLGILKHNGSKWDVTDIRSWFPTQNRPESESKEPSEGNIESFGEDGMGGAPSCDSASGENHKQLVTPSKNSHSRAQKVKSHKPKRPA